MDQLAEENPYRSPEFPNIAVEQPPENDQSSEIRIRKAIYWSVGQALVVALFTSLVLDGGVLARCWGISLIPSWIATVVILLRYKYGRSHTITKFDIAIIKYGVWPIFGWFLVW